MTRRGLLSCGALRSALAAGLLAIGLSGEAVAAGSERPLRPRGTAAAAIHRRVEIAEVLTVLDRRIANPQVRERAAGKLALLDDHRLALLAALSARAIRSDAGPAGEVALLLVTALLVVE